MGASSGFEVITVQGVWAVMVATLTSHKAASNTAAAWSVLPGSEVQVWKQICFLLSITEVLNGSLTSELAPPSRE